MSISPTNRITWKGISLGQHAFISTSFQGNNDVRIIPRAIGAIIRNTFELGGGILTLTIKGVFTGSDRLTIENYFLNAHSTFNLTLPGDLVIDGTTTITNCYLESFDQNEEDLRSNTFTFKFVKGL